MTLVGPTARCQQRQNLAFTQRSARSLHPSMKKERNIFSVIFCHFLSFSFIFLHFPSFSFIFIHFPSFSFIFLHFPSFSFIFFHFLSFSFVFFRFSFVFFRFLSFSFIFFHFLLSSDTVNKHRSSAPNPDCCQAVSLRGLESRSFHVGPSPQSFLASVTRQPPPTALSRPRPRN